MVKSFYTNIINPNLGTDSPSSNVTNPMTTTLDMGGNPIIGASQATQNNGVPTLSQVQGLIANSSGGWNGNATSSLNMNLNPIKNTNYIGFAPNGFLVPTKPTLTIQNDSSSLTSGLSVCEQGGANPGLIYDSYYNKPPGDLPNLAIVDGNLEYKEEIVLTAQSGTQNIETLALYTPLDAGSVMLPVSSNIPAVNDTTFKMNGSMTYNSTNRTLNSGSAGSGYASSNFTFGNGSILGWSTVLNHPSLSVSVGFYRPPTTAGQPPTLLYQATITNNASNAQQILLQYDTSAGEAGFDIGTPVTINTPISVSYFNNIFQVLIDGVVVPLCDSNNPAGANIPLTQTTDLNLI